MPKLVFASYGATQAPQRLCPGSPKKTAGYQSRPRCIKREGDNGNNELHARCSSLRCLWTVVSDQCPASRLHIKLAGISDMVEAIWSEIDGETYSDDLKENFIRLDKKNFHVGSFSI
jgi:hypothetical protein